MFLSMNLFLSNIDLPVKPAPDANHLYDHPLPSPAGRRQQRQPRRRGNRPHQLQHGIKPVLACLAPPDQDAGNKPYGRAQENTREQGFMEATKLSATTSRLFKRGAVILPGLGIKGSNNRPVLRGARSSASTRPKPKDRSFPSRSYRLKHLCINALASFLSLFVLPVVCHLNHKQDLCQSIKKLLTQLNQELRCMPTVNRAWKSLILKNGLSFWHYPVQNQSRGRYRDNGYRNNLAGRAKLKFALQKERKSL